MVIKESTRDKLENKYIKKIEIAPENERNQQFEDFIGELFEQLFFQGGNS